MKAKRAILLVLIVASVAAGCRKPPEKVEVREPIYPVPPVEDFEGLYAYAVGRNGYCTIDLYKGALVHKSKMAATVSSACLSTDGRNLYLGVPDGVAVVDLVKPRIIQRIPLAAGPQLLLSNPMGGEVFSLDSLRGLSVIAPSGEVSRMELDGLAGTALVTPNGANVVVSVSAPPRSFIEVIDWVTQGVSRMIDVPNAKAIASTPYGARMYCLSGSSVFVHDGRSFERIGKIDFHVPPEEIRMTPAGNKIYFLAGSKIYVVSRVKNSIISELDVAGRVVDLKFSADGGFAYLISENPDSLLIMDAGIDSIIFSKGLDHSPQELVLSPAGSRVYIMTTSGSLAVFEVREQEFTSEIPLSIKAFQLIVNKNRISMEKEVVRQPDTIIEGIRDGFTIQISSSRDISSANALASKLKASGYPAYVSSSGSPDGLLWYRVRVGMFEKREDSEVVAKAVTNFQRLKCWVTNASINTAMLPELSPAGRDMDSDGKPEAVYKIDPRHLVVYKIDRGAYVRVYSTSRDEDVYLGEPRMRDIDADGDLEAVTELLEEGKVSVIDFANGVYTETLSPR